MAKYKVKITETQIYDLVLDISEKEIAAQGYDTGTWPEPLTKEEKLMRARMEADNREIAIQDIAMQRYDIHNPDDTDTEFEIMLITNEESEEDNGERV